MKISSLYLKNYRNIEELKIDFSDNLNIFVGENGQGKTNILESIYLLLNGDSFRFGQNDSFIKFNQTEAYLSAKIESLSLDYHLKMQIDKSKKKLLVNDKPSTKSSAILFGHAVLFSPESLNIIKNSAEERRELLDELVITSHKNGYTLVQDFKKALRSRNRILKDISEGKSSYDSNRIYFESLNTIFLNLSTELSSLRWHLLQEIRPIVNEILKEIENKPSVEFDYHYLISDEKIETNDKDYLYQKMSKRQQELHNSELSYGSSLIGPQRHDITFLYTGKDSRFFSSQGQQRSIILAYKMAQIVYHQRVNGFYPILLLDDVLSELDQRKQAALISYLNSLKTQTFLTTTHSEVVEKLKNENKIKFMIQNGKII